ncbi:DNA polymerase IV [Intestinimonas butyriciproducens]|uniref:DNA polymerase IV n=1 Tax=Intestinimonas butyriciproducens TaxID=1297617 RepID=UPI00195793B0|nr:DNA polymerase IV [Intestinimonas butyriciproducens]MBM6975279.1 DNA polymerase IV [Intestinimonas butyriciproducens]
MERTILHCDLNGFYASVELRDKPELWDKPVAVCGDPESRHGIILAKNEVAKKFQVKTAETIWQARRKCPDLILLPAHHDQYRLWSQRVNAIYERYTDLVEPFGIDESWLDITGSMHLFGGDGRTIADQIRGVVKAETGLTISVGVSFNKVFAKLGSDMKKPDATTVLTRSDVPEKVWPLPVTDLLFVGRASAKVLRQYGVHTIGDLAAFGRERLEQLLGKQGGQLYEYASGLEHSPVTRAGETPPPKSVGNGITFRRNLIGWKDIHTGVALLSDSVAARLRKHAMKCTTVQVTIRDPNFKDICRQARLAAPSCTAQDIGRAALGLIRCSWNGSAPIRALTITGQNLLPEGEAVEQLDLFTAGPTPRREKREQLERAMDGIRNKYGRTAIRSAITMDEDIDHPAGHAGSIPPPGGTSRD